MAAAEQKYKVKPGSVVVFLSERFQTRYEPKWQVLEIKVRPESHLLSLRRVLLFDLHTVL